MASGSYEIDTYSWYRSLPLNGCTEGYSTGTMFAVGPCAFLQPYTFYQYQSTLGFTDTSTMSISFGTFICTSLLSTTSGLQSSINENRRQFVSSIPLTQWISTQRFFSANLDLTSSFFTSTVTSSNFPWFFQSTFSPFPQNFSSSFISSISTNFISSGLFGFITSNIYPTCAPYSLFSSIPVLTSSFTSTLGSTIPFSFTSTMDSSIISSLMAMPFNYDFSLRSTFLSSDAPTFTFDDRFSFNFPAFWLGDGLQSLIDSRQYDVIVDLQYSLFASTSSVERPDSYAANFLWVSTVGTFGNTAVGALGTYRGVTSKTRIGNCNYIEVFNRQMFHPTNPGTLIELAFFNSNYRPVFNAIPPAPSFSSLDAFIDIYMPGEDNMIITLVPTTSTILT
jgi:hypothetical protein